MKLRLGIFDSGIGGFSVLTTLLESDLEFDVIYLADIARNPYGEKNVEEIRVIAKQIAKWFKTKKLDGLLIACNTTNSCALDILQNDLNVPCFDLIESVSETITENKVGVLATTATVNSSFYKRSIEVKANNISVFQQACPQFVSEIEKIPLNIKKINMLSELYLKPLLGQNVREIILGCSHYPLIYKVLRAKIPSHIKIIDPSLSLIKNLNNFFKASENNKIIAKNNNVEFFATANIDQFSLKVTNWLEINKKISLVNLQTDA